MFNEVSSVSASKIFVLELLLPWLRLQGRVDARFVFLCRPGSVFEHVFRRGGGGVFQAHAGWRRRRLRLAASRGRQVQRSHVETGDCGCT